MFQEYPAKNFASKQKRCPWLFSAKPNCIHGKNKILGVALKHFKLSKSPVPCTILWKKILERSAKNSKMIFANNIYQQHLRSNKKYSLNEKNEITFFCMIKLVLTFALKNQKKLLFKNQSIISKDFFRVFFFCKLMV